MTRRIEVKSDKRRRTFTIRVYTDGFETSKYRTIKMGKEDFEDAEYNTSDDWSNFLLTSDQYYEV